MKRVSWLSFPDLFVGYAEDMAAQVLPSPSGQAATADSKRLRADRALFQRLADHGDPFDRELLVERFLPLAKSLAARYRRNGEPFDDIFQVACLGLVKAIDRYDLSVGRAFSSFAVPTIAGEIKRYYRDRTWSVHVPRGLQELTLTVDRARGELEAELGRSPTATQIAERVRVTEEDVVEALQASHAYRAASLDAPAREGDDSTATVGDLVAAQEKGFARAETRADLRALGRVLQPRARLVIGLRFERDMTQQQIGEIVGLSQMQVSRILRAAIARLREHADHRRQVASERRIAA
jgi:RNA polymerase sigma-B factor